MWPVLGAWEEKQLTVEVKNNSSLKEVLVPWAFIDERNGDEEEDRWLRKEIRYYRENNMRKDSMNVCVWWAETETPDSGEREEGRA